jgi:hypothetical protein
VCVLRGEYTCMFASICVVLCYRDESQRFRLGLAPRRVDCCCLDLVLSGRVHLNGTFKNLAPLGKIELEGPVKLPCNLTTVSLTLTS